MGTRWRKCRKNRHRTSPRARFVVGRRDYFVALHHTRPSPITHKMK